MKTVKTGKKTGEPGQGTLMGHLRDTRPRAPTVDGDSTGKSTRVVVRFSRTVTPNAHGEESITE